MIVVDQNNSGQTVDLPVGQQMELRLAENPTTGFRWAFVDKGEPACIVVGDHFEAPSGPPGRGGEHTWQIKAAAVGDCEIALQYRRGFQPDTPARSFTLHVHVTR